MRLLRLTKIVRVGLGQGLDRLILDHDPTNVPARFIGAVLFWRDLSAPRAERLRRALESLGPIFVKFGQVLSTRRDLLPPDIAEELAKLQDQVPPFPSAQAIAELERAYGKPVAEVFATFDAAPVASASVAQVHFATLHEQDGGREVAVKILRPGIAPVIDDDIALLDTLAGLLERLWSDGKRLKPREVVAEFAKHLHDELDLMREAASCSQLRRNFTPSPLLQVPEVCWDWCTSSVMVMERMRGIPISQTDRLREAGVDLKKLSRAGVEIFFTQVFRDGFFHADMHPGNILVATDGPNFGKYVALDFGIMGTLNEVDKNYLAINFLAFFRRDYHRVAEAHIESGWAPKETRVDELEAAVRAVCEPISNLPSLQRRNPAAARPASKDAAQRRGAGSPARPRARSVANGQAIPRTLDGRADRLARPDQAPPPGNAAMGDAAAAVAPPGPPGTGRTAAHRAGRRTGGIARGAGGAAPPPDLAGRPGRHPDRAGGLSHDPLTRQRRFRCCSGSSFSIS